MECCKMLRKGELPFLSYIWDFCAPKKQHLWLWIGSSLTLSASLYNFTLFVPCTLHFASQTSPGAGFQAVLPPTLHPLWVPHQTKKVSFKLKAGWQDHRSSTIALQKNTEENELSSSALNCMIKDFSLIICPQTINASHSGGTGTVCWGQMEQELFHGRIRGSVVSWMFLSSKLLSLSQYDLSPFTAKCKAPFWVL